VVSYLPWARRFLRRVPRPIPQYGTPEWEELPHGDVRRWAALVVAAEHWRDYWTAEAIAERLREDLSAENRRCLERWTDAMNDVRGERRMTPDPEPSTWPAYAELERRRNESGPAVGGP
jgi:hypothetical protein